MTQPIYGNTDWSVAWISCILGSCDWLLRHLYRTFIYPKIPAPKHCYYLQLYSTLAVCLFLFQVYKNTDTVRSYCFVTHLYTWHCHNLLELEIHIDPPITLLHLWCTFSRYLHLFPFFATYMCWFILRMCMYIIFVYYATNACNTKNKMLKVKTRSIQTLLQHNCAAKGLIQIFCSLLYSLWIKLAFVRSVGSVNLQFKFQCCYVECVLLWFQGKDSVVSKSTSSEGTSPASTVKVGSCGACHGDSATARKPTASNQDVSKVDIVVELNSRLAKLTDATATDMPLRIPKSNGAERSVHGPHCAKDLAARAQSVPKVTAAKSADCLAAKQHSCTANSGSSIPQPDTSSIISSRSASLSQQTRVSVCISCYNKKW